MSVQHAWHRWALSLAGASLVMGLPSASLGYTIQSGVSDSCHEVLTIQAFTETPIPVDSRLEEVPVPKGNTWRRLAEYANRSAPDTFESDVEKWIAISLVTGVRSPDTGGHSIADLGSLRDAHTNPSKQYQHFLRTNTDDGADGDRRAIRGSVQYIRDTLQTALAYFRFPMDRQIELTPVYFDFYGQVEVEVWKPMFLIGVASHTLQDSFSHTVRSGDLRKIRHVMNFIDAVDAGHDAHRDGLAHSSAMDDCNGDAREIADVSKEVTRELYVTITQALQQDSMDPIDAFLARWFTYESGCTLRNKFCDSPWNDLARRDPTTPFLPCSIVSPGDAPRPWIPGAVLTFGWYAVVRSRRRFNRG